MTTTQRDLRMRMLQATQLTVAATTALGYGYSGLAAEIENLATAVASGHLTWDVSRLEDAAPAEIDTLP
jgi:hypothetical protein